MSVSQSEIMRKLNQRPIAFYPIYREMMGRVTGGVLLSQLMYWFSKKDKFWKTNSDIQEETSLHINELKTAKKQLKTIRFITVTLKGLPAKTWYEIDWDIYAEQLAELVGGKSTSQLAGNQPSCRLESSQLSSTSETTSETTLSGPNGTGRKARNPELHPRWKRYAHPRWKRYAQKFADAIKQSRKINKNSQVISWASSFRLLHEKEEVSVRRIKVVLRWYCKILQEEDLIRSNGNFIPVAISGKSFREKFIKLEDAMKRQSSKNGTHPPVKMTKDQKEEFEDVSDIWLSNGIAQAEMNGLSELVVVIDDWYWKVSKRMESTIKRNQPVKIPGGFRDGGNRHSRRWDANQVLEHVIPCWHGLKYFKWVAQEVSNWSGWGGNLKEFYPGKKHFRRFTKQAVKMSTNEGISSEIMERLCNP